MHMHEEGKPLANILPAMIPARSTAMSRLLFALCFFSSTVVLSAQSGSTFPVNGTPDVRSELHVFEGASLHLADGTVVSGGPCGGSPGTN